MSVSRFLTAVVARSLLDARASVSTPQLRVLVVLASRGPSNLTGVAAGLGVDASNASRACDQLVTAGLVSRDADPSDRRSVVLDLTDGGRVLVADLMDLRRAVFSGVLDRMTSQQRSELASGLAAFLAAARTVPGDVAGLVDGAEDGGLTAYLG